jgi:ABC-2 type transport system permease protein
MREMGVGRFLSLIGVVARRDYLRVVKRRGFIIGTLLLPLGIAFFVGLSSFLSVNQFAAGPVTTDTSVLIVNESSLPVQSGPFGRAIQVVSEGDAQAALADGGASEYYVVPPTYPGSPTVQRIEAPAEGLGGLGSASRRETQEQILAAVLQTALLADSQLPPEVEVRVIAPLQVEALTTTGEEVSPLAIAASFLVPFAFTLLFVMSIFITSGYLLQSVTEEKENRVVEIVLSSVPPLPLMGGKILGLGAAGLTQVAIWVLTLLVALPLLADRMGNLGDIGLSPATLALDVIYFVLGYLAYGAIFAAVGAIAPGNREAQQYSGFFGFIAVIPLIFTSLFLTDPTSIVVWVLALFPLTTPATMLQVMSFADEPPVAMIGLSLLSLGLFVVLGTIACARIFRATLLLYGVRPGLRQIVSAVTARA